MEKYIWTLAFTFIIGIGIYGILDQLSDVRTTNEKAMQWCKEMKYDNMGPGRNCEVISKWIDTADVRVMDQVLRLDCRGSRCSREW